MNEDWMEHLESGAVSNRDIRHHLARLRNQDRLRLNLLMNRIVEECPNLELLPALGFRPFSFHIKGPRSNRISVHAAVHPQIRNGVRFMCRRSLPGFAQNRDPQLRWQSQINVVEDIEVAIRYLRSA